MHWIEARLKQVNKRKKDLAEAMGLPNNRISEIIRGKRRILASEVLPMALCLGISPMTILLLCDEKKDAADLNEYWALKAGIDLS
ncbi:MAG: helix-turn-helix domain-containing protein [Sneathiella sp.]